jgi:hypothetical protein
LYDQSDPMMMGAFSFIPLLAFILIAILFAIGFAKIAGRMGKSPVLWAVLSLVPVVNYFFWIYAMFVILLYVLDRLNAIGAKLGAESPAK